MDMLSLTLATLGGSSIDTSTYLRILIIGFVIAFCLAFGVGANDVSNSFGTSVDAKVLILQEAWFFTTTFEVRGAVLGQCVKVYLT